MNYNKENAWIQTYSGKALYPWRPTPDSILIEDIAHALAGHGRWGNHSKEFMSVGNHSMLVAMLCKPENRLWALLHDASEAYLGDIPTPIKRCLPDYTEVEKILQTAIYRKFGLFGDCPKDVKEADARALFIEKHLNMGPCEQEWERKTDIIFLNDNEEQIIKDSFFKFLDIRSRKFDEEQFLELFYKYYKSYGG